MHRIAWWASLLLGLVAVAHAEPDPFAKVPVAFESEPSGAKVWVSRGDPHAEEGCSTPCALSLPPWEVQVTASLDGHPLHTQRVDPTRASGPLTLKLSPAESAESTVVVGVGTLRPPPQPRRPLDVRFESTPAGAVVHHYAPTRPRCTSPCSMALPRAGAVVVFMLDGHVSRQVWVVPGRQPVVQVTLGEGEGVRRVAVFDDPPPVRAAEPDEAFARKLEAAMAPREPPRPRVVAQLGEVQVSPPCDAASVRSVLAYRIQSLSVCHGRKGALAAEALTAMVQLQPGGRVARVLIEEGPGLRTRFGTCVARWFKRVSVPGHASAACRLRVPVRFEVQTPR